MPHRRINGRALRGAGHRALADVEHVGRRSGTVRHAPVRAFRSGDTVVVGLNVGADSDWVRNIVAAGGCRMRPADERLPLTGPRIVPVATAFDRDHAKHHHDMHFATVGACPWQRA
jgi:deazaflavin-dependent oxidoreductase (nitroreductase family)